MIQGRNVVLIHGFKEYCAILFFKGALLKDPQGLLVIQSANVRASRQIRFTNPQQIVDLESTIRAYVQEAVAVEKAGLKVEFKETREFIIPAELHARFAAPKQAKTREARIDHCTPRIFDGLGLND